MMFWGNHMGFGGWGMLLSGLLWIGLIVLGVWLLARLFPTGGSGHDGQRGSASHPEAVDHQEKPLSILQRRYARGEITKEEYETIRHDLTA